MRRGAGRSESVGGLVTQDQRQRNGQAAHRLSGGSHVHGARVDD